MVTDDVLRERAEAAERLVAHWQQMASQNAAAGDRFREQRNHVLIERDVARRWSARWKRLAKCATGFHLPERPGRAKRPERNDDPQRDIELLEQIDAEQIDVIAELQERVAFWQRIADGRERSRLEAELACSEWMAASTEHRDNTLATALLTIRDKYGHVCEDFATCTHEACRDSYAAWHLADEALKAVGNG